MSDFFATLDSVEEKCSDPLIERHRYAYVWLVMKGDSYTPGALISAFSVRLTKTTADLVCMVTPDVSDQARSTLSIVFDRVIEVKEHRACCVPLKTTKQQQLYGWMDIAFTKWACLSFYEYEKVCFIDADKIFLTNNDSIFQLPTPAGTFDCPWAKPYRPTGQRNPYPDLRHGDPVPRNSIDQGFRRNSFVAIGTFVLLSPDPEIYQRYLNLLNRHQDPKNPFGSNRCFSGMDEQSIVSLYHYREGNFRLGHDEKYQWTMISSRYQFIPWHRDFLGDRVPKVIHYLGNKPWALARLTWPDLEAWWQLAQVLFSRCSRDQQTKLKVYLSDINLSMPPNKTCFFCQGSHVVFNQEGALECRKLV